MTSTPTVGRGGLAVLFVLAVALAAVAGCLSETESDAASSEREPTSNETGSAGAGFGDEGSPENESTTPAPDPPIGRQWTYEAQGAWNDLGEFNVVLARAGDDGLVLAGASPEDLDEEVVYDRPWHGPVDEDLNPAEGTTFWDPLFDFPLHDGKRWSWGDGDTVRAVAKTVETPSGPSDGFEMVLEARGEIDMRWTYAPSVAFLASFTYEYRNTTVLDIQLVDVSSSEEWIWFEEGPEDSTSANPEPGDPTVSVFDVPDGYDAVVVAAGVEGGGEATVQPPPSSGMDTWTYEGSQEEQWTYDPLPGHEGYWTLQANREPSRATEEDGYAGVSARAVAWIQPDG